MSSKKNLFVIGSALLIAGSLPLFAHSAIKDGVFGGKITSMDVCTCIYDPALMLTIDDVVTGESMTLKYGLYYSKLHKNYMPFQDANVVGGYTHKGNPVCLQQAGYYCDEDDEADAIVDYVRGVGTSYVSAKPNLSFKLF